MRSAPLVGVLALLLFVSPLAGVNAQIGNLGWPVKTVPFSLTLVDATDGTMSAAIAKAAADWSAGGTVSITVRSGNCSGKYAACDEMLGLASPAYTLLSYQRGYIQSARIYFKPANALVWTEHQREFVACHEIGNSLGLGEGLEYSNPDPASCMSTSWTGGATPTADDLALLASLYPNK